MKYFLVLVSLITHHVYTMNSSSEESNSSIRSILPLKILAAQRVDELKLSGDIVQKNTLDEIFFEECRKMPEPIFDKHMRPMLANIQRNNDIASSDKRVK